MFILILSSSLSPTLSDSLSPTLSLSLSLSLSDSLSLSLSDSLSLYLSLCDLHFGVVEVGDCDTDGVSVNQMEKRNNCLKF